MWEKLPSYRSVSSASSIKADWQVCSVSLLALSVAVMKRKHFIHSLLYDTFPIENNDTAWFVGLLGQIAFSSQPIPQFIFNWAETTSFRRSRSDCFVAYLSAIAVFICLNELNYGRKCTRFWNKHSKQAMCVKALILCWWINSSTWLHNQISMLLRGAHGQVSELKWMQLQLGLDHLWYWAKSTAHCEKDRHQQLLMVSKDFQKISYNGSGPIWQDRFTAVSSNPW